MTFEGYCRMSAWRLLPPLAVCLLAWVGAAGSIGADQPERPNILFAFADDWGRHASIYAQVDGPGGVNDVVRTPVFDRLARQGVLFRHAFVSAPSCTPCRSALLSGQHFWRTGQGAILQGAIWDDNIPAYPLLVRDAGYHIGKTYKVWSPGSPVDAPYGHRDHVYQQGGSRFNQFSQTLQRLTNAGKSLDEAKQELLDEVRTNFRTFLEDRKDGRPFCYWFGPTNVHRKWVQGSGKKYWDIDPDDLKGKMPPFLPDVHTVREDLADYFGEVEAFDLALQVLVDELERSGDREQTLLVISGDHGAPGFPHGKCNLYDFGTSVPLAVVGPGVRGGRVVDDLVSLTDLAPTFLEAAGVEVPEVITGRSLWPLLKSEKSGQVDPERTVVFTGRERHVAAAREGHLPYPQRAIRTPDHLLIVNFRPERYPLGDPFRLDGDNPPTEQELKNNTFVTLPDEDAGPTKAWMVAHRDDPQWRTLFEHVYGTRGREQLFDLKRDPHQMKNLAWDPDYAEVLRELRNRLMDELRRTGDPRLKDGGAYFENPPLAGPLGGGGP